MKNLQILVVEGDESRADRIISSFTAAGHSGVRASSCEEAAEFLAIQRFDAVLLGSGHRPERN